MEPSGASCRERSQDEGHRASSLLPQLTHLQVIQEPGQVQAPPSSIPVAVRTHVFETGVREHAVVVLWEEEEEEGSAGAASG